MKLGIAATTSVTPAVTADAQVEYVRDLSLAAEEAGFDSVWVSDRTVYPSNLSERYPEQFGPGKSDPRAQNLLEAVTTLSYIAGITTNIRLGMSVQVLPFRHPVLNAKMLTTLDVLSGGRLIAGFGTGWMPEEFEAMGVQFSDRGRDTDEQIRAFKALCAGEGFEGRLATVSGMTFFPQPAQKPHPPIWIGGNSTAAMSRAVRHGDGWHGIRYSPDELIDARRKLDELCRDQNRDSDSVTVSLRTMVALDKPHVVDGVRTPLTGSVPEISDDLRRYRDAGLDYLVVSVDASSTSTTVEAARKLRDIAR